MEIERRALKSGSVRWRVRWRQGGRYRAQTFDRKGDAVTFASEIRRRQQLGTLVAIGQIQSNPARAVRKAPLPRRSEVRPLASTTIEHMRAASNPRDATLISVLAYAGLRPGEALALQWRDIREQSILVERAISLGEEKDTETAARGPSAFCNRSPPT